VKVLKGINIDIKSGQLIGFLGKIGSGKSSLLYSLIGETVIKSEKSSSITLPGEISLVC